MIADLLIVGAALFAYAVAVMVVVPMAAARRRWTSRNPRTAIVVWIWALGSGGLALAAGLTSIVVAATRMPTEPVSGMTLGQVVGGVLLTLAAYGATAVGGGLGSLVVYRMIRTSHERRSLVHTVAAAPRTTRLRSRETAVTVVPGEAAAAMSVAGRQPTILVSSRLRSSLTPQQLEAVIEHERGHLRHGHHRMVQLAHLQYTVVPLLPCARALDRSVRMLVELAADDYASRRCGREMTASALRAMSAATGDSGFELRAQRLEAVSQG